MCDPQRRYELRDKLIDALKPPPSPASSAELRHRNLQGDVGQTNVRAKGKIQANRQAKRNPRDKLKPSPSPASNVQLHHSQPRSINQMPRPLPAAPHLPAIPNGARRQSLPGSGCQARRAAEAPSRGRPARQGRWHREATRGSALIFDGEQAAGLVWLERL